MVNNADRKAPRADADAFRCLQSAKPDMWEAGSSILSVLRITSFSETSNIPEREQNRPVLLREFLRWSFVLWYGLCGQSSTYKRNTAVFCLLMKKKKQQPKNPLNLQTEVFVCGKFTAINLLQFTSHNCCSAALKCWWIEFGSIFFCPSAGLN